ncbi:MAG: adenylate kinase family protein [Alphaproteobacteria bacterium]
MDFYILAGSLASGKGTQAKLITKFLKNSVYLSIGELFRTEVKSKTKIGLEAEDLINKGILVSNKITNELIKDFLDVLPFENSVLLDGYPRSVEQVKFLENFIKEKKHILKKVFVLDLNEEIVKRRILGRFECINCKTTYNKFLKKTKKDGVCDICGEKEFSTRKSDTEEVIEQRLNVFKNSTLKGLEFYESQKKVIHINANQKPNEVFEEIKKEL